MSNTFEDQVTASARRMRKQSESHLSVPDTIVIPQKRTRYWGWIATPAAAAVGLLIGLFSSHFTQTASFFHHPAERHDNFTVPIVAATDHSGHSIVEDGTDYSLLVSL